MGFDLSATRQRPPNKRILKVYVAATGCRTELAMAKQLGQGIREAFTFDDVLLKPGLSDILPSEADVAV
jgi:IMP dehydrogenase